MKDAWLSIAHVTVWRLIFVFMTVSIKLLSVSLWGEYVMSREINCPVYMDREWQKRDQQCDGDKKYHCFVNENGDIVSDGCYIEKLCLKGAHPVVDYNHIRCDHCQTGFQREDKLKSSTFIYSFCERHSAPCKPEYGESQCRAGMRERDRACTCNASLGFSPRIDGEDCDCFTPNDACSGCKFTGCLEGTVRNSRGFCEPDTSVLYISTTPPDSPMKTSSTFSASTRAVDDSNEMPSWGIALIVVFCIVAVVVVVLLVYLRWPHKKVDEKCLKKKSPRSHNVEDMEEESSEENPAPNGPMIGASYTVFTDVLRIPGDATINVFKTRHLHVADQGNETALRYQVDPSSTTPLIGGDPSTPQITPDTRHPSASRSDPPPASVSSALPSPVTYCENDRLLPAASTVPLPTDPLDLPVTPPSLHDPSAPPPSLPHPSAPPPSFPDPSAPPPSFPDPSAPPPSFPDPSAPPPSFPDPSAPPPSFPDPSAPPPSFPDPSAPSPSLPHPSAPPPSLPDFTDSPHSLPVVDQSQMEEEKRNSGLLQLSEDDETLRKLPRSSHNMEVDDSTHLLSSHEQETASHETRNGIFCVRPSDSDRAGPVSVTNWGDGKFSSSMKTRSGIHIAEEESRPLRSDDESGWADTSGFRVAPGMVCTQATQRDAEVTLNNTP